VVIFRRANESLVCSEIEHDSFFKPEILRSKRSTTSHSSIDKRVLILSVSKEGSLLIFSYIFSSSLIISIIFTI
jgi:hypothetical protein